MAPALAAPAAPRLLEEHSWRAPTTPPDTSRVLEGLEAVRKRPGMYIGSTDSRGLMHCLWEIIDNSVDEALGGHGTDIDVILHADGSVEVRDTRARHPGRHRAARPGSRGVEVVFTKLHAGGKFGGGSYAASGGLHGVGASVVNALSERLDVEVDRDGKTWAMSFHRGEPGIFADTGEPTPDAPFTPFDDEQRAARRRQGRARASPAPASATGPTGRSSRRAPTFQLDELRERARQTAFLVPGLELVDRRRARRPSAVDDETLPLRRRHLRVRRASSRPTPPSPTPGASPGTGTFTETVPVLQPTGRDGARPRSSASARSTSRCAGAPATTPCSRSLRQHHRDAEGRHAPAGLRAGAA